MEPINMFLRNTKGYSELNQFRVPLGVYKRRNSLPTNLKFMDHKYSEFRENELVHAGAQCPCILQIVTKWLSIFRSRPYNQRHRDVYRE